MVAFMSELKGDNPLEHIQQSCCANQPLKQLMFRSIKKACYQATDFLDPSKIDVVYILNIDVLY